MIAKILTISAVTLLCLGCASRNAPAPQAADDISGRYALLDDGRHEGFEEKTKNMVIVIARAGGDPEYPWRFILVTDGRKEKDFRMREVPQAELAGFKEAERTRCISGSALFCASVPGAKVQRRKKTGFEEVTLKTGYFAVVVDGLFLELEKLDL